VGAIVVVITGGAWFLIAGQFIPAAKEAARAEAIREIERLSSRLAELDKRSDNSENRLSELLGVLRDKLSVATAQADTATARVASIQQIYEQSASIAKGFADVNKTVNDLANNHELQEAVADRLSGKVAQLQSQVSALSLGLNKEVSDRAAAVASLSASLTGVVVFAHEDASCPQGYIDLSSALFPRWHVAFDQNSFITPKDKAGSGNWPGNTDWRLDHIRLCMKA
jgi:chaperonin cofactor prefoldin